MTRPSSLNKLLSALEGVQNSITFAKQLVSHNNGVPASVIERLDHYSELVGKQIVLTGELLEKVSIGDHSEVFRHAKLINSLTVMILEDITGLLAEGGTGINPNTAYSAEATSNIAYIN